MLAGRLGFTWTPAVKRLLENRFRLDQVLRRSLIGQGQSQPSPQTPAEGLGLPRLQPSNTRRGTGFSLCQAVKRQPRDQFRFRPSRRSPTEELGSARINRACRAAENDDVSCRLSPLTASENSNPVSSSVAAAPPQHSSSHHAALRSSQGFTRYVRCIRPYYLREPAQQRSGAHGDDRNPRQGYCA